MARYIHRLVKKVAIGIASEAYENEASINDAFFKANRSLDVWVSKNWKYFIKSARKSLARMLGMKQYDESVKKEIYEALLEDRSLPPATQAPPTRVVV